MKYKSKLINKKSKIFPQAHQVFTLRNNKFLLINHQIKMIRTVEYKGNGERDMLQSKERLKTRSIQVGS